MQNKIISVVIPAYNAQKTIYKCLKAFKQQTLLPLEVIVVDDGSTDKTASISAELAVVISNGRKKGAGGARNTGAYVARGEIIAFIDSDCIPCADWVEKISKAFDEDGGIGAVAGGYCAPENDSFISKFAFLELNHRRRSFPVYIETAVSNNLAVKADLFKQLGGFPEVFSGATLEDMIFTYKISRIAKIRWLADNGIRHHFPVTIKGYLQQQYRFGRDTVLAYKMFPGLTQVKTHQGRLIYIETLIASLTLCGLISPWPFFASGIFLIWFLNSAFLRYIFRSSGMLVMLKALFFIPVRDFNWVRSIVGGIMKLFRN